MGTQPSGISLALTNLLTAKSRRDNYKFTPYKLAKYIGVDRSLITRLISGEVQNPRIDTLKKIVKFFINDGFTFTLSLNDLVNWDSQPKYTQSQIKDQEEKKISLPVFLMNRFTGNSIGTVTVMSPVTSSAIIAVVSEKEIKPIFKTGSVFIIDLLKEPKKNNLVMVRIEKGENIKLKRYIIKNNHILYQSLNNKKYISPEKIEIIGVVIKINVNP